MIVQHSLVIRDGKEKQITSREIVPLDIVILRDGDRIPADGVILEHKNLRVNESTLTGEAKEVAKLAITNGNTPESINKVFMGTYVVNGYAKMQVLHTGMKTEFGKIANMISHSQKEIPLQQKINKIIKYMAINAVIFAIVT